MSEAEWEKGFLEHVDSLTPEQIEQACEAAFANAVDLLEEADLLRANGRCARAFFLAHIACEELGKLPILTTAAVSEYMGYGVDWRRIDALRRQHGSKIKQVLFVDSLFVPGGTAEGVAAYEADLKRLRGYTDMKNASLHSTFLGGEFSRPLTDMPCDFFDSFRAVAHGRLQAVDSMFVKPVRIAGGLPKFLATVPSSKLEQLVETISGPEGSEAFETFRETGDESKMHALFDRLLGGEASG